MKKSKVALISGITVAAAVATVAAIGIQLSDAAQLTNASPDRSSGTEAVSTVSTSAPSVDASGSQLPTTPVSGPSGSVEYAASWRLDSSSGRTLSISIIGPGSGCTTLGYVHVSETATTVTVTPEVIFDQKPGEGCTANLSMKTGTITLPAPLDDRTLFHGRATAPTTGG